MSATITLVLAVHNHQPVGNFDFVIERAVEKSYRPFLEVLDGFPEVKLSLHYSGILLDWFKAHNPELIERVRSLVARGQVEILGGGYYEPILPVLPVRDQIGQMRSFSDALEETFGVRPSGLWLPERVWEPQLPGPISSAGLKYVVLDDTHFKAMGFRDDQLLGYYTTEDQGATLAVFPTKKKLRYTIPFAPVEEVRDVLETWAGHGKRPLAVMGDDGEKFGIWPGTHKRAYEEGWLKEFFTMLLETPWIETATFSEVLRRQPPLGMVYLPMCSYEELLEWQYPSEVKLAMERLQKSIGGGLDLSPLEPFFSGGMWRNFLVKYREANHLHKRMWRVSEKIASVRPKGAKQKSLLSQATEALYRGQCNDGYWHGIFGGLYLPHIRASICEELIKAESMVDAVRKGRGPWMEIERVDFDLDGHEEIIVGTPNLGLIIHPDEGGMISTLDYRPLAFNCINSLQRRKEAYHEHMVQAVSQEGEGREEAKTIHERAIVADSGVADVLSYDWYARGCFCEHILDDSVGFEEYSRADFRPMVELWPAQFEVSVEETERAVDVTMTRQVHVGESGAVLDFEKRMTVQRDSPSVSAEYRVSNSGGESLTGRLAVEWNFGLLGGNAPDRYYRVEGTKPDEPRLASKGPLGSASSVELVDEWRGLVVGLEVEPKALWWRFPVETISQSESGVERVYQSSAVVAIWALELKPGEERVFQGDVKLTSRKSLGD